MPKRLVLVPGLLLLLVGCGDNGSGEPGPVLTLNTISAGGNQTCGTNSVGEILCWGKYSDIDHLVPYDSFLARPVTVTSVNPSTDVVVGSDALRCVIRSGSVACWGDFAVYDVIYRLATEPTPLAGPVTLQSAAAGFNHVCGLSGGAPYCMGANHWGQLGNGVTAGDFNDEHSDSLVAVVGSPQFISVLAGGLVSCGLNGSSKAYCWGANFRGQIGAGIAAGSDCLGFYAGYLCARSPLPVVGGFAFTALSIGGRHVCGVRDNGKVYCWGEDLYSQLGVYQPIELCDGVPCSGTPYPVNFLPDIQFTDVSAGTMHTCALTVAGDVWCWGLATDGQLGATNPAVVACGDGGERCATRPSKVAGVRFRAISAGNRHTCGISLDNLAYCWGSNAVGQGGRGIGPGSKVPINVAPPDEP